MSALSELADFIRAGTVTYRKGAEVTSPQPGVVEVYAMPPVPEQGDAALVDVHFIVVGFTEAAADRDGFEALLRAACAEPGAFLSMSAQQMTEGPSYLALGGFLGSQDLALRLIGLLAHYYRAGQALTPAALRIVGPDADMLAGSGMVMCPLPAGVLG